MIRPTDLVIDMKVQKTDGADTFELCIKVPDLPTRKYASDLGKALLAVLGDIGRGVHQFN